MKKQFRLKGLGCANCASKMESQISKLPGVDEISINFLTTKMIISADDSGMDDVLSQCAKIIDKIEPGVVMVRA